LPFEKFFLPFGKKFFFFGVRKFFFAVRKEVFFSAFENVSPRFGHWQDADCFETVKGCLPVEEKSVTSLYAGGWCHWQLM
jgi:hypothetical protein